MKRMASLPNCRRRGNVCLSLPTFNYRRDTLHWWSVGRSCLSQMIPSVTNVAVTLPSAFLPVVSAAEWSGLLRPTRSRGLLTDLTALLGREPRGARWTALESAASPERDRGEVVRRSSGLGPLDDGLERVVRGLVHVAPAGRLIAHAADSTAPRSAAQPGRGAKLDHYRRLLGLVDLGFALLEADFAVAFLWQECRVLTYRQLSSCRFRRR